MGGLRERLRRWVAFANVAVPMAALGASLATSMIERTQIGRPVRDPATVAPELASAVASIALIGLWLVLPFPPARGTRRTNRWWVRLGTGALVVPQAVEHIATVLDASHSVRSMILEVGMVVVVAAAVPAMLGIRRAFPSFSEELARRGRWSAGWSYLERRGHAFSIRAQEVRQQNSAMLVLRTLPTALRIGSSAFLTGSITTGDERIDGLVRISGDEAEAHALLATAGPMIADLVDSSGSLAAGVLKARIATPEDAGTMVRDAAWLLRIARKIVAATRRTPSGLLAGVRGKLAGTFRRRCLALLEERFPAAPETSEARALAAADPILRGEGSPGRLSVADPSASEGALSTVESRGGVSLPAIKTRA